MTEKLVYLIADLKEDEAFEKAKELLEGGTDTAKILNACGAAMEKVGSRYEEGQYYLPDLMLSGEILERIAELVKGYEKSDALQTEKSKGIVLLGTVEGDLHDIGKNIVKFLIEANGYKVVDIGVDVKPEVFVNAIKEHKPDVVGFSALLTLAFESMKKTIEAIESAGLRDQVKVIIGGAPVDQSVCNYVKADAFARDAQEGVRYAQKWI